MQAWIELGEVCGAPVRILQRRLVRIAGCVMVLATVLAIVLATTFFFVASVECAILYEGSWGAMRCGLVQDVSVDGIYLCTQVVSIMQNHIGPFFGHGAKKKDSG